MPNLNQAVANHTKGIRDSVYGYIEVPMELVGVVDHPMVQRLRHISPSGFAHHVYPGLAGSEFAHALGAMHLAGECWHWLWQHSPLQSEYRQAIIESLPKDVDYGTDGELDTQIHLAVQLLSLLRNVAAPPFSYVLTDLMDRWVHLFVKGIDAGDHEAFLSRRVGLREATIRIVAQMLRKQVSTECPQGLSLAWWIVEQVDCYNEFSAPWVLPLRSLTEGGIDTHRIDYVIRDSLLAGTSEYGAVDLNRLTKSFFLHRSSSTWRLVIHARARSAIEGFISQRLQFQRWIHHHSHVAIVDAYFEEAVEYLLEIGAQNNAIGSAVKAQQPNLNIAATEENILSRAGSPMTQVDDIAMMSWLRRAENIVNATPTEPVAGEWRLNHYSALYRATLHRTPNWVSVWNNEIEYSTVADLMRPTLRFVCTQAVRLLTGDSDEVVDECVKRIIEDLRRVKLRCDINQPVQAMNLMAHFLFGPYPEKTTTASLRDFNQFYNLVSRKDLLPPGRWTFVYSKYTPTKDVIEGCYFGVSGNVNELHMQFPSLRETERAEQRIERFYATYIAHDDDEFRVKIEERGKRLFIDQFMKEFPVHLSSYLTASIPALICRQKPTASRGLV